MSESETITESSLSICLASILSEFLYLAETNFNKVIASSAFITIAGLKATKKQRKRKHWMSTVYQSRDKYRGLDFLIDLKRDMKQFINFCRMSSTNFYLEKSVKIFAKSQ